eukprot:4007216-Alexandrium_andersonii.AAC.1
MLGCLVHMGRLRSFASARTRGLQRRATVQASVSMRARHSCRIIQIIPSGTALEGVVARVLA